jgi:8-oxo-dGTP diphosphatase
MKASDKKEYPGVYDPVGGHIESGEDIVNSARREIKEETGLSVSQTKLKGVIHVNNFFGKDIMMFIITCISDTDKTPPAHEEGILEWIQINQLDSVKIFEDLKPIIKKITQLDDNQFLTGHSSFDNSGKLQKLDLNIT